MRLTPILAVLVAALAASASQADPINYRYDFLTPAPVTGDAGNFGTISFATTNGGQATGHTVLTAASLAAVTSAPLTNPDTFSGQTYAVTIDLTDLPSGHSGSLTFTGALFGSLTPEDARITTTFSQGTKTLTLGNDTYTVTLGPLVDPSNNNPTVVGTLMATVDVRSGSVIQVADAPEPASLMLAALGVAAGVWSRCRRSIGALAA
jgi:hypothetical protein